MPARIPAPTRWTFGQAFGHAYQAAQARAQEEEQFERQQDLRERVAEVQRQQRKEQIEQMKVNTRYLRETLPSRVAAAGYAPDQAAADLEGTRAGAAGARGAERRSRKLFPLQKEGVRAKIDATRAGAGAQRAAAAARRFQTERGRQMLPYEKDQAAAQTDYLDAQTAATGTLAEQRDLQTDAARSQAEAGQWARGLGLPSLEVGEEAAAGRSAPPNPLGVSDLLGLGFDLAARQTMPGYALSKSLDKTLTEGAAAAQGQYYDAPLQKAQSFLGQVKARSGPGGLTQQQYQAAMQTPRAEQLKQELWRKYNQLEAQKGRISEPLWRAKRAQYLQAGRALGIDFVAERSRSLQAQQAASQEKEN